MARRAPALAIVLIGIAGCSLERAGLAEEIDAARLDASIDAVERPDAEPDAPAARPVDGGPCDSCDPPMLCCDGACVDPRTDPLHCGGCTACGTGPRATPMCTEGACDLRCDDGFDDCDGDAANGCEADLGAPSSCGSCRLECASRPFASATCGAAGCGFVCDTDRGDCNDSDDDGCEIDLESDAMHCGACRAACAPGRGCEAERCVGWTTTLSTGGPGPRWAHSAVWTGTEMIVWGGETAAATLGDGAAYDPSTDSWRTITMSGAPSPRRGHTAVWTGTEMVIWGGFWGTVFLDDGAAYHPGEDRWRPLSTADDPSERSRVPGVWTGTEMIVWGGWSAGGVRRDGARWSARSGSWTRMATDMRPLGRRWNAAVWTGARMLVVFGEDGAGNLLGDGFAYDPVADTWSEINDEGAPIGRARSVFVYASGIESPELIVWGGDGGNLFGVTERTSLRSSGGRYDPASNGWRAMAAAPIAGRALSTAVWTGQQMLIWGGEGAASVLGDGAGYDPVRDTWTLMRTAGAPTARARHTAVWTGTEMIVFGGIDVSGDALTGLGRYAP